MKEENTDLNISGEFMKIVLVIGFLLASFSAKAQVSCSSQTITTTPVELTSNTAVSSTTARVSAIKVSNLNSANNVCCSDKSAVACSGNNIGEVIAPAGAAPYNFLSWAVSIYQKWYCIASSANTSIQVCTYKQ